MGVLDPADVLRNSRVPDSDHERHGRGEGKQGRVMRRGTETQSYRLVMQTSTGDSWYSGFHGVSGNTGHHRVSRGWEWSGNVNLPELGL